MAADIPPQKIIVPPGVEFERPRKGPLFTKQRLAGTCAFLAALALVLTNIDIILAPVMRIWDYVTTNNAPDPELIHLDITDSRGFALNHLQDDTSCLMHITIRCGGKRKLFIRELEFRHYRGVAQSISTGQLQSSAKYRFVYRENQHAVEKLAPPLVIVPSNEEVLDFQIELAPDGPFSGTAGSVYAQLNYEFEDGTKGSLPLVHVTDPKPREVLFPILSENTMEPHDEPYKVTANGNVVGKNNKK
jgi:hypothetical protein